MFSNKPVLVTGATVMQCGFRVGLKASLEQIRAIARIVGQPIVSEPERFTRRIS
ncbi:MAG: hypothetical protein V1844_18010 [Pseudomonadota bacterium]